MKRIALPLISALMLPGMFAPAWPQALPAVTAIKDVRIFDGESVIPRGNVVISGTTITACGPDAPIPAGAAVIEGRGKTVLPGLIDSRIHTIGLEPLKQALVFGGTAVIDMFMDVG